MGNSEVAILEGNYAPAIAAATPAEKIERIASEIEMVQMAYKRILKDGVHYGVIPGCGKKPTLLKAGSEILLKLFNYYTVEETETIDLGDYHREYIADCTVYKPNGEKVAQTKGSCSTLESKYRYKRGADIADIYNTCLKIAVKRAKVAAALACTCASDIFTMDLEDSPETFQQMGGKNTAPARAPYTRPPVKAAPLKAYDMKKVEADFTACETPEALRAFANGMKLAEDHPQRAAITELFNTALALLNSTSKEI